MTHKHINALRMTASCAFCLHYSQSRNAMKTDAIPMVPSWLIHVTRRFGPHTSHESHNHQSHNGDFFTHFDGKERPTTMIYYALASLIIRFQNYADISTVTARLCIPEHTAINFPKSFKQRQRCSKLKRINSLVKQWLDRCNNKCSAKWLNRMGKDSKRNPKLIILLKRLRVVV